jgi:hypothetical protein
MEARCDQTPASASNPPSKAVPVEELKTTSGVGLWWMFVPSVPFLVFIWLAMNLLIRQLRERSEIERQLEEATLQRLEELQFILCRLPSFVWQWGYSMKATEEAQAGHCDKFRKALQACQKKMKKGAKRAALLTKDTDIKRAKDALTQRNATLQSQIDILKEATETGNERLIKMQKNIDAIRKAAK